MSLRSVSHDVAPVSKERTAGSMSVAPVMSTKLQQVEVCRWDLIEEVSDDSRHP
jgi:hypothetical protein